MLTRSGVAKRLGKSIATVRRMEGVELHPTLGADGVHLFDPGEVDDVACGRRGPTPHRIADLTARGLVTEGDDPTDAESRVAELESELARERTAHAAALAKVQQEAREKEQQAAAEAHELAALLDSIPDRDLAALDEDDLDEFVALLEAVDD
jgi:hypothetical protein